MSKLTEVSLFPESTERQKVSTFLKVYYDANCHALLNHRGMHNIEGVHDTFFFSEKSHYLVENLKVESTMMT